MFYFYSYLKENREQKKSQIQIIYVWRPCAMVGMCFHYSFFVVVFFMMNDFNKT